MTLVTRAHEFKVPSPAYAAYGFLIFSNDFSEGENLFIYQNMERCLSASPYGMIMSSTVQPVVG